ncbi:MAG: AAA family ATPase [Chloroflexia bacterium]
MRVKTIELLGFKSFAQRTRLDFGDGIAAVVGPNGSGKSNLVDAVRWVLGEQSYGQLRGRRTEDVVWGGGAKRAPAGLAEVTITLDNTDRSLPSPYAEVAITRRAYRSGENEYLINRSRVRLRDVVELTSALGQNHTVVGQGAVESLLALTPQGRRGVFEDAADIATHYARRDETLQRLARVQSDATRARDIEAEIEPRLRSLARQARQARDRIEIEQELAGLTLAYHSREVSQARVAVQTTAAALKDAEVLDRRLTHESSSATEREAGARSAEGAARTNLRELEARRTVLADEYAHASRAAASSQAWLAEVERRAATTAKHHAAAELACQAAECKLADADEALRLGRLALDEAQQTFAEQKRRLSTEAECAQASREALRELRRKVHTADEEAARARSRAAALDSAQPPAGATLLTGERNRQLLRLRCAAKDAERRAHTVFERCETAVRAADCELEAEAQARGDLDRELAEASNLCGELRSQAAGLQSKLALLRDPSDLLAHIADQCTGCSKRPRTASWREYWRARRLAPRARRVRDRRRGCARRPVVPRGCATLGGRRGGRRTPPSQ